MRRSRVQVPKNGLLSFFYCRSAGVVSNIQNKYPTPYFPPEYAAKQPGGTAWVEGARVLGVREKMLGERFLSIADCFKAFDKDGSGDLTRKEFVMGLVSVGVRLRSDEIEYIMSKVDKDGSGKIEVDELQAVFGE